MWTISHGHGGLKTQWSWSGSTSHTGPEERLEGPIGKTLWRTLTLEERNNYRNWLVQGKVSSVDKIGRSWSLCLMPLAPRTSYSSYAAVLLLTTKDEQPSNARFSSVLDIVKCLPSAAACKFCFKTVLRSGRCCSSHHLKPSLLKITK